MSITILDNGASTIKYGDENTSFPKIMPNCIARVDRQMTVFVGDQIYKSLDGSLLRFSRPFDCGYLTNWACEIDIWNYLFNNVMKINTRDQSLVITEPPFNLDSIQNDMTEVIFEEYNFQEYMRRIPAWFTAYELAESRKEKGHQINGCLVIDSGFSFSHSLPLVDLHLLKNGVKRVNVGGKLLTNYLKELVSYRQWNMMDEFRLVNQVKDELCFVSLDLHRDLQAAKSFRRNQVKGSFPSCDPLGDPLKRFFVLPDYHKIKVGYVKPLDEPVTESEQLLQMETERFTVPEVLFNPGHVGMEQAGVVEAAWQGLKCLHLVEIGMCTENIILVGGNAKLPQYEERFRRDVRPFVPDILPINVHVPINPIEYTWQGMSRFVRSEITNLGRHEFSSRYFVSKSFYLEHGHHACNAKLNSY